MNSSRNWQCTKINEPAVPDNIGFKKAKINEDSCETAKQILTKFAKNKEKPLQEEFLVRWIFRKKDAQGSGDHERSDLRNPRRDSTNLSDCLIEAAFARKLIKTHHTKLGIRQIRVQLGMSSIKILSWSFAAGVRSCPDALYHFKNRHCYHIVHALLVLALSQTKSLILNYQQRSNPALGQMVELSCSKSVMSFPIKSTFEPEQ